MDTTKREEIFADPHVEEVHTIDLTLSPIAKKLKTSHRDHEVDMLTKLKDASPYNILFNTIPKSADTLSHQTNTVTFTDLICPSLGVLKCTFQLNYLIDIQWLLEQYKTKGLSSKPITIIYGKILPDDEEGNNQNFPTNMTHHIVKMQDLYGTHHSKLGIYVYEDESVRIVISTANLFFEDWSNYNQGLWMSPSCPKMSASTPNNGESPTGFKADLLRYLKSYKIECLKEWIGYIRRADFSAVRVFLVTSTPGKQFPKNPGSHVYRVEELLKAHCVLPAKTTPDNGPLAWGVLAQASSIGSLGYTSVNWLKGTMLRSLASHQQGTPTMNSNPSFSFVYPSMDNVMNGYFGEESGGCLFNKKEINEKQRWFKKYLYQWKADGLERTKAMPHIKTYCRISPCQTKLAYFLLTSANLSKAAWGANVERNSAVYVRSYEVGVMFLPKFFDEEYFEISRTLDSKNEKSFPFIYDLPLTIYKTNDNPWCT